MDKAIQKKMDNLKKKNPGKTDGPEDLGKTQYNDADDDDKDFLDAKKEEDDDMEFGGQSQFMTEEFNKKVRKERKAD